MKMFQWSSAALGDYTCGDIIVVAKNVKEARNKVREYAKNVEKLREARMELLEKDISQEPYMDEVVFIRGSD